MDEEIEPDDFCPMKTPKVIGRKLSEDNETGVDLEHHWKNRINDIVLCIIVPIDSYYESSKYRRLGRQTLKKGCCFLFCFSFLKITKGSTMTRRWLLWY